MTVSPECKARFWSRVSKTDGCWLWTGGLNRSNGYGQIQVDPGTRHMLAHRLAWILAHPECELQSGQYVLHKCDNPRCVRPEHLFLGTHSDNMQDMLDKGRGNKSRGTRHGLAKLSDESVVAIRTLYAAGGHSMNALAVEFGVAKKTILNVVNGRTWTHLMKGPTQ